MENPIGIVLLIIAGVIYKIYEGYKEEQAKAKKRAERLKKKPQQQQAPSHRGKPRPTLPSPRRPETVVLDYPTTDFPEFQTPAPSPSRPDVPSQQTHQTPRPSRSDRKRQEKTIEVLETDQIESGSPKKINFDLREAVIQQAILNRPYSD